MANTEVPADTLPVRTATLLVAAIPVPASPSGGHTRLPGCKLPLTSRSFAPSSVSVPASSPADRTCRQDLSQFPWISFFFFQFIELFYHLLVIIYGFRIDREHTGSVADTQNFLPGQFPVDITGQCSEKCDIFYMFFTV